MATKNSEIPRFLVVFADNENATEWGAGERWVANMLPASSYREAEQIVNKLLSEEGLPVARIFAHGGGGTYVLADIP